MGVLGFMGLVFRVRVYFRVKEPLKPCKPDKQNREAPLYSPERDSAKAP